MKQKPCSFCMDILRIYNLPKQVRQKKYILIQINMNMRYLMVK